MEYIVKRHGRKEKFDERKMYATCYAAGLNTALTKKEAEKFCENVCKEMKAWVKKRKIVTSDEIFKQIIRVMKRHNRDVAFMYETHRDLC